MSQDEWIYILNVKGTYFLIKGVHKYILQLRNHCQHRNKHKFIKLNLHFKLSLLSFVFSLESFHPRPKVYHFSFSSFFTFDIGAASLGGSLGMFVSSPKAPQAILFRATRDFLFIITISPISGSTVGSTKISKPFLAAKKSAPT